MGLGHKAVILFILWSVILYQKWVPQTQSCLTGLLLFVTLFPDNRALAINDPNGLLSLLKLSKWPSKQRYIF